MKIAKSITTMASMLCLIILLTACSTGSGSGTQAAANGKTPSETLVLKVGDNEVYLNEINYYAIAFIAKMGITEASDLDAAFSQNYETLDEALKAQFLVSIRQSQILYEKALEEGVTLTDEENAAVGEMVRDYIASNDGERLDKFGIDEELLTHVFTVYQTVQKFEQQIVNEMDVEAVPYGTYYNFVFLTIELDDNGNAVINDDGTYVYLSESEQERQKELAEEVRGRLADGEAPEDLIEEYDLSATSGLVHATTESLRDTFGIKDGEISEVRENDFGYIVARIEALEDTEYTEYVRSYNASSQAQDYLEEKEKAWLDEYPIKEEDIVEKVWNAFTFKDFL